MGRFQPRGAAFSKSPRLLQATFSPEMYKQVRALQAREGIHHHRASRINENEYLKLLQSQKGDLMTTTRSSFKSSYTRNLTRMASKLSRVVKESSKEMTQSNSDAQSKQYLEVPKPQFGLAKRMDFILRKRTRLIERQKTKENKLFTFGAEKDDPMPGIIDVLRAEESDESDHEARKKYNPKEILAKKKRRKMKEIKKIRGKYNKMIK